MAALHTRQQAQPRRVSSSPRRSTPSSSSSWTKPPFALGSAFGDSGSSTVTSPISAARGQKYDDDLFITTSWTTTPPTSISASPKRMGATGTNTFAAALDRLDDTEEDPSVRLVFHRMRTLALDDSPSPDGTDEGFVPSMLGPPLPKVPGAVKTAVIASPPPATRTASVPPVKTSVLGPPLHKVRMRVRTPPLQSVVAMPISLTLPMPLVSAPPPPQPKMPLTPRSADSSVIRRRPRRGSAASDSGYSGSEEDSVPTPRWELGRRPSDGDTDDDERGSSHKPRRRRDPYEHEHEHDHEHEFTHYDDYLKPQPRIDGGDRLRSPRVSKSTTTIVHTPPETPQRRATAPSTPPRSRPSASMISSASSKYHIPRSPGTPHLGRASQLVRTPGSGSPMPRSPGCRSLSSLT